MAGNQSAEALSVQRLINEVLVQKLGIPAHNIVNDMAFPHHTGIRRPDITISNEPYEDSNDEERFVNNLICYLEAKDIHCKLDDADWKNAINQCMVKAPELGLHYFGVTNCRYTYFYNLNGKRLSLNGNPISEPQAMDVLRLIKHQTGQDNNITDIQMGVDTLTAVSEAVFDSKLWQLKNIYRGIDFENNNKKIDFTIGMVSMEYYEEKAGLDGRHDESLTWWSTARNVAEKTRAATILAYITRITGDDSEFKEFADSVNVVREYISGASPLVRASQLGEIYNTVDSMSPLHGTGFDLFGAVYEAFANSKEKKDFGEYFTSRHYAHIFAKLLFGQSERFNTDAKFTVIDPFCGTGGMLTEAYKVLRTNFEHSNTFTSEAKTFLSTECFYGIDIRKDNASRSRLNMFLVGDGHNHIYDDNSFVPVKINGKHVIEKMGGTYNYVITNPPYGQGTVLADTSFLSSRRMEIAAICRVIDLLRINGEGCIITPDGILENPSFKAFRKEILMTCEITHIVSLPKFAFAPYTKEKTYAVFIKKRYNRVRPSIQGNGQDPSHQNGMFQTNPIWMYILDYDGFANSDKRYPTRLRGKEQKWEHDEISSWVDTDGNERISQLEDCWRHNKDDAASGGETWTAPDGEEVTARKCGYIDIENVTDDEFLTLLPEKWLRPYDPPYVTPSEMEQELDGIMRALKNIA
ncbi:class I SAM-dependent DNA methyltransferase [Bifidobacterium aquikefiricola]|uniref:N-6 DNA methylase n=1 Tax=Bifidobacterium aquikefiricola TaxID=3059038 RepID=A0AB39U6W8_9BIFI